MIETIYEGRRDCTTVGMCRYLYYDEKLRKLKTFVKVIRRFVTYNMKAL